MPQNHVNEDAVIIPPRQTRKSRSSAQRRRGRRHTRKDAPKPAGWLAILTLIGLTVVAYLPVFQSGLIWSDYDQVERSAYQSMDHLAEAWTVESIRKTDSLTLSSYFLEEHLPLPEGQAHHGINLLLHIAAALIFLKVLQALKLPAAYSASLVFALHPTVMQTLFWSGYRMELIGLICILAALFFGIRNRSPRDYAALLGLTALAGLAHPVGWVLPLLLSLVIIHEKRFPKLKDFNHLLPVFCLAIFIGIWTQSDPVPFEGTSGEALSRSAQNFFFSLEQALLPTNLALFHPPRTPEDFTAGAQYSFLPVFLLIPFYVLILFNYGKPWARSIFVGLTAYLLLGIYGLRTNGVFLDGQFAHENHLHYLSLPFIIALVVCTFGGVVERVGQGGKLLWYFGFTIFILMLSAVTFAHSLRVSDRASMWLAMSEQWPEAWVPKVALIETMQTREESDGLLTQTELISMMEAILDSRPDLVSIRIALARTYRADGQDAQALRHYRWIARQESPVEARMREIADFYEKLGLSWDAQTIRVRIRELYETDSTNAEP
jgi:hypothetical protein